MLQNLTIAHQKPLQHSRTVIIVTSRQTIAVQTIGLVQQMAARQLTMPIQEFINNIEHYYFVGQQGIGLTPAALMFDSKFRDVIHYEDSSCVEVQIHTPDWQPLASSRKNIYVDPGRQLEV